MRKTLFKNFFSDEMEWLSHDYGNEGVVDISVAYAYSGMELCTPILLGEASKNKLDGKSFLKKKIKTNNGHHLTKLNVNKNCYVDSIWL
jgi:hypothetical protein